MYMSISKIYITEVTKTFKIIRFNKENDILFTKIVIVIINNQYIIKNYTFL
jgi:hypothetical protein